MPARAGDPQAGSALRAELVGDGSGTHLRKLQARHGDRQCSTQVGMLKMEHRLGSSAVGPPPLIMITLCTRSGYSWARKVQKETLQGQTAKWELR